MIRNDSVIQYLSVDGAIWRHGYVITSYQDETTLVAFGARRLPGRLFGGVPIRVPNSSLELTFEQPKSSLEGSTYAS